MKKFIPALAMIFAVTGWLSSCNFEINKTIRIEDGTIEKSSLNSVNGGIIIGKDCQIRGDCRAVNGQIDVGENSQVRDLQSINGNISISRNVTVDGDVSTVNGSIVCQAGVTVSDDINSINGDIELYETYAKRDVTIRNGNITVRDSSRIGGDIVVGEANGKSKRHRHIDINIANDSVVEGGIIVEDNQVEVRVYLSNGGAVQGKIINAEVIEQ